MAPGAAALVRIQDVPIPRTPLVGREREARAVCALLLREDVRLVVLTGPGGIGKTRLALHVAAEVADAVADGVCIVGVASVTDPELVTPTIGRALGLQMGSQPPIEAVTAALRGRQLLLVLDNFEQVLPAASAVDALLRACPSIKMLVTSRAVLRLSGEHVYAVPPLDLPDPRRLPPVDRLRGVEAVRLFGARASAVNANFAVTDENAGAIAEICLRLDGLPLAIELAAARSRLLAPAQMVARLQPRLPLLTGGAVDAPSRQQTLRDAIAWSHDLLDEGERRLFRRLGVFAGGWTLDAAEAIAGDHAEAPHAILDRLESLAGKSLIRQEASTGGAARFGMLETIREFAVAELDGSGEAESVRRRHAEWFTALAESVESDQGEWTPALEREGDNFRGALVWSETAADGVALQLRLAGSLWLYWRTRGLWHEGRNWLERTLARTGAESRTAARARVLCNAGDLAWRQGDQPLGRARLEESESICRELGDRRGLARPLAPLGLLALEEGDVDDARSRFTECIELTREQGDRPTLAIALDCLGDAEAAAGDLDRAAGHYAESLAIARELGHPGLTSLGLHDLGRLVLQQGDARRAARLFAESLALRRASGFRYGVADCLAALASAAAALGQPARAARLFGAAEAILRSLGGRRFLATDLRLYERHVADCRAALGAATYAAIWAAGLALSDAEADDEAASLLNSPPADHDAPATTTPDPPKQPPLGAGLTPREREVLQLLAEGLSNAQIADRLVVSPRTVSTHLTGIYGKLGVPSRAAAVRLAMEHRLT